MSDAKNTEQTVRIFYGRSDIRGLGPDARLHPCGEKPLRPFNDIPISIWKSFEDHPQIKGLIADGSIKVLDEVPVDDGKGKRAKKSKTAETGPEKDAETPAPPPGSEAAQALANLGLS